VSEPPERARLREWWALDESQDAHVVMRVRFAFDTKPYLPLPNGPHYGAACGLDITAVIERGFRADGVIVSCERLDVQGACEECVLAVFDIHWDDAHACEITTRKRRLGIPLRLAFA
jgi:hypothetical protein